MPNMQRRDNPTVTCVLGMHRSGTSLVAGLLHCLGIYVGPPNRLVGPRSDNEKGFWEHSGIVQINDELLAEFGGSYDAPPRFPIGWYESPKLEGLRTRARRLIEEDFSASTNWGWKDPRACLTLPFWQRLLPPMRYVVCLRNPVDVGRSLRKRNGISFNQGVQLWLSHVASLLEGTTGSPRYLVLYESMISAPDVELRELAAFLEVEMPKPGSERYRAIEEFVDKTLQHHATSPAEVISHSLLSFEAKALYRVLLLEALSRRSLPTQDIVLPHLLEAFSNQALQSHERNERQHLQMQEWMAQLASQVEALARSLPRPAGRAEASADYVLRKEIDALVAEGREDLRGVRFGDRFVLLGGKISFDTPEPTLELAWESCKVQRLEWQNAVHFLDEGGNMLGQADYPQDASHSLAAPGAPWRDIVRLSPEKMGLAKMLGLGIYKSTTQENSHLPQVTTLPVGSGKRDWGGHRLLVNLK